MPEDKKEIESIEEETLNPIDLIESRIQESPFNKILEDATNKPSN